MSFLATLRANLAATALGALAAILLVIAIVQTVRIEGFGSWPLKIPGLQDKYDNALRKLVEARAELERISSERNKQAETTDRNIRESEKRIQTSDKVAREIEAAPLPGNCATPPEILGADL
jgi:predicted PurR-regulated permease PerM